MRCARWYCKWAWKVASLREAGTHIMGRATYEVSEAMAAVWPTITEVYADVMNEIPKVVFSTTLTRADWAESRSATGPESCSAGLVARDSATDSPGLVGRARVSGTTLLQQASDARVS